MTRTYAKVGPVLVVAGVIQVRSRPRRVLLAKRTSPNVPAADGRWECPGGKVEFGETLEEALKRELMEELDIEVDIGRVLAVVSNEWDHLDDDTRHHNIVVGLACTVPRDGAIDPAVARYVGPREANRYRKQGLLLPGTEEFIIASGVFR